VPQPKPRHYNPSEAELRQHSIEHFELLYVGPLTKHAVRLVAEGQVLQEVDARGGYTRKSADYAPSTYMRRGGKKKKKKQKDPEVDMDEEELEQVETRKRHNKHQNELSKELLNLVPQRHYPKLQSRLNNSLEAAMLEEGGGRFLEAGAINGHGERSQQEHWQAVRSFHVCFWEADTGYISAPSTTRTFATAPRPVAACL
jgi:hypothetical protein